jgi:ribonuclease Z
MNKFIPCAACLLILSIAQAQSIHVTLLGTSGPSISPSAPEAGLLVEAGGETLLFDCGRGVPERITQLGPSKFGPRLGVNKVFLSHLHSDHTEGLPVLWMNGWGPRGNNALNVWGPGPDVDTPTGAGGLLAQLQTAFATNTHIRRDLVEHNPAGGILINATEVGEGVVYQNNGVTVTAFLVDHKTVKPAFGYRVDYSGHSVVFSGDTTHSENLIKFAKGADVLIHEVLIPAAGANPSAPNAIRDYHTTPEQAADVFKQAAPRLAVYTHIVGTIDARQSLVESTRAAGYSGPLEVGQDLMSIDIAGTIDIHRPSSCPTPRINSVTDSSYGNNITADGTLIVWGTGFTPSGGNSIQLVRPGYDSVTLDESDGPSFWDQSQDQINAALGGKVAAGQWQVSATNFCGTVSLPAILTVH